MGEWSWLLWSLIGLSLLATWAFVAAAVAFLSPFVRGLSERGNHYPEEDSAPWPSLHDPPPR